MQQGTTAASRGLIPATKSAFNTPPAVSGMPSDRMLWVAARRDWFLPVPGLVDSAPGRLIFVEARRGALQTLEESAP